MEIDQEAQLKLPFESDEDIEWACTGPSGLRRTQIFLPDTPEPKTHSCLPPSVVELIPPSLLSVDTLEHSPWLKRLEALFEAQLGSVRTAHLRKLREIMAADEPCISLENRHRALRIAMIHLRRQSPESFDLPLQMAVFKFGLWDIGLVELGLEVATQLERKPRLLKACMKGALRRLLTLPIERVRNLGNTDYNTAVELLWLSARLDIPLKEVLPRSFWSDQVFSLGGETLVQSARLCPADRIGLVDGGLNVEAMRVYQCLLSVRNDRAPRPSMLLASLRQLPPGLKPSNPSSSDASYPSQPSHLVIRGTIPSDPDRAEQARLKRFECLENALPLTPALSVDRVMAIREQLNSEFPWAQKVIAEVLDVPMAQAHLAGKRTGISNTLLVGHPGCGKSRLARRVGELLGLPFMVMSLAGMTDSRSFTGTARGWSNCEPSPLVRLLADSKRGDSLVLLDEIDKCVTSNAQHGSPHTALLNLLEPEGASRYWDVCLMTGCDLSKISYIATSNSVDALPKPLLSRFKVLWMPQPDPEQIHSTGALALRDLLTSMDIDPKMLDFSELACQGMRASSMREFQQLLRIRLGNYLQAMPNAVRH